MAASHPVAVLDACVLFPPVLRDLLMWLAVEKLYQPKWTEEIHAEWIENVLESRTDLTQAQLERTRDLMNKHGGDCLVTDYTDLISEITLPDPDDRHVLAAAIVGKAQSIVTWNVRDFPASVMTPYNIRVIRPDAFVCGLYEQSPERVRSAVRQLRETLKNPPKTAEEVVERFRHNGLIRFADYLTPELDVL